LIQVHFLFMGIHTLDYPNALLHARRASNALSCAG